MINFKIALDKEMRVSENDHRYVESFSFENISCVFYSNQKVSNYYRVLSNDNTMFILMSHNNIQDENRLVELVSRFTKKDAVGVAEMLNEEILVICDKLGLKLVNDKSGVMQVYYNSDTGFITSDSNELFDSIPFNELDTIAVHDFICYGTLIGERTFHKKVKKLSNGCILTCKNLNFEVFKYFTRVFGEEEHYSSELLDDVYESYKLAVKRSIDRPLEDMVLFASGGIDSRFLLSVINTVSDDKIECVTFGQKNSQECNVARMMSEIDKNPFTKYTLTPADFVLNSEEYISLTAGMDMYPQSFFVDVSHELSKKKSKFLSGFALDVILGGTFLDENVLDSSLSLYEYVENNRSLFKMNVFSENEFKSLCSSNCYDVFFSDSRDSLKKVCDSYGSYHVSNLAQTFAIENRDCRAVIQRELVPARNLDVSYPSMDRSFLENASRIPIKHKIDHKFYQELFMKYSESYSSLVYNNTNLPISAPISLWGEATDLERKREEYFVEMQKNSKMKDTIYYPHFYSDFNGYSRKDNNWREITQNMLLSKNSMITQLFFDKNRIKEIVYDHYSGRRNNRKKIVYLASLEMFLRKYII